MTDAPTLDSIASAVQDTQFTALEDRLVDAYGTDRRATVHALVEAERNRFAEARIHAFVPILVERSVRLRLAR
jgi:hypothetical protein